VLDEETPFLQGRPLNDSEEAYYDLPALATEMAPLYEHCVRAIRNGLRFGRHGLPLMRGGDWNDGMNRVGHLGEGESVWLAFFLYRVLLEFAEVAQARGDEPMVETCRQEAARLQENIELHAWDGGWYLRAFFDDGTPLGSATNTECQIDSLPQSWAVLSGAGNPDRARQAMRAVLERLVQRDAGLVQLFDPPFDRSTVDPGYIKGYVPGVRENGGQYTHAAIWLAMALAELGERAAMSEILRMINPIRHGQTPEAIAAYQVEPYVMAADVYAAPAHLGRGGWTWYTGSAGWMYQLIVHSLVGVRIEGDTLYFRPCLPAEWPRVEMEYRHRDTPYHITIENRGGSQVAHVVLDGIAQQDLVIRLSDDRREHTARVELG
jgi:cellobiose phosphorylase